MGLRKSRTKESLGEACAAALGACRDRQSEYDAEVLARLNRYADKYAGKPTVKPSGEDEVEAELAELMEMVG